MSKYTVRMTPDAEADVDAIDPWWETNRHAAKGLTDEFDRIIDLLADMPFIGTLRPGRGIDGLRRIRLKPTPYFVYYATDEQHKDVVVLAVCSGMLRSEPRF